MRIILILIVFALLGVLFYNIKNKCCGANGAKAKPSATSVSQGSSSNSEIVSTAIVGTNVAETSTDITTDTNNPSANKTNASSSGNDTVSSSGENIVDSRTQDPSSKASSTYNHDEYTTIRSKGNLKIIPFSADNNINVEVQALLEETCTKLEGSLTKVHIHAYGRGKVGYLQKMEDFLIRCGLSPTRVTLSHHKVTDEYNKQIVVGFSN